MESWLSGEPKKWRNDPSEGRLLLSPIPVTVVPHPGVGAGAGPKVAVAVVVDLRGEAQQASV